MQAQAQGKAVVITGAAGGVGYAYADEFLANGMKVMIGSFSRMIVSFLKSVRIHARPRDTLFPLIREHKNTCRPLPYTQTIHKPHHTTHRW